MAIFLLSYIALVIFFIYQWNKILVYIPTSAIVTTKITVVIAAKNEAHNIIPLLQSLELQTLAKSHFEVVLVDDFSTDNTIAEASFYQKASQMSISIVRNYNHGKKSAIARGIEEAQGEIIVCTDADCVATSTWLETIAQFFKIANAKLAFGPVLINTSNTNLFHEMQQIEFASLVGSGAACWQSKIPNMCNGANIAYLKSIFYEVNGFVGNEKIASGDDEFLMQKVYAKYPDEVFFLKSYHALVSTQPIANFSKFYQQRTRWASKFEYYTDWKVQAVAFYIFCVNLMQIISFFFIPFAWFISIWAIRALSEYIFLGSVLGFMHKRLNLKAYLLLVLAYPFYVVFFALAGRFKNITK